MFCCLTLVFTAVNIEAMIINERQKPIIRNRLRFSRMTQKLNQEDLAFLMGLVPTQISKWEHGERLPSIYNAVGLAVMTGRMVDEVFWDYRKEWIKKREERMKLLDTVRKKRELI